MILTLALLIATGAIAAAFNFWKKSAALESDLSAKKARIESLRSDIDSLKENATNMSNEIESLKLENSKLEPFRIIVDAEQKAREILTAATAELEAAKQAAVVTQNNAAQNARNQIEQAAIKLDEAGKEADRIIAAATKRAEEIAGNAYKALENATNYENTAKAMKNVIEGYGDQYIIPTYSLLDELADEFGFTEAGAELKKARERSRHMVKSGRAATCDYVEINRKETAIRFVVDAFNGKVDSILSRSKADNIGTLQQAITDSFSLVNHNGAAFRSARITQEFLDARLEELKWAVVVQELKERDKEEQRRIKEQIREEERAHREFEKAMRDAEKEEELLRKAMEKIQKEVDRATDEQKAVYETRLQELNEKLREAEERSQRALSMAQQTKAGHVYVISNIGSFGEEVFKIGMTRRLEPRDRVRELGDASVPFEFDIHAMIYSEDAPNLERTLQKTFLKSQMNKVNPRKEFFKVSLADIRGEVEHLGVETHWTIAAAARDYRESLAIERAMRENPESHEEWLQHQLAAVDEIAQSIESEDYALSSPT
jgi:hypothetical protein